MSLDPKVLDVPLTVKIRTGVQEKSNIAHKLIPEMKKWGISMVTVSLVAQQGPCTLSCNVEKESFVGFFCHFSCMVDQESSATLS